MVTTEQRIGSGGKEIICVDESWMRGELQQLENPSWQYVLWQNTNCGIN
jgi:hypothetical protein